MPIIGLEQIRLTGPHGYYEEEALTGNTFLVDIFVYKKDDPDADSEDLANTINYEILHRIVLMAFRQQAQLLETLGQRIITRIEEHYPLLEGIKLCIRKLHPPLSGQVGAAYWEKRTGYFK